MWFKRKYYGWYPATWEGWVVTGVYVGVAFFIALSVEDGTSLRELAITCALPFALLTAAFARVCYKTSESSE